MTKRPGDPHIRDMIRATIASLVEGFVCFDRKDCQYLSRGELEAVVMNGEVTIDEMVGWFREGLEKEFKGG